MVESGDQVGVNNQVRNERKLNINCSKRCTSLNPSNHHLWPLTLSPSANRSNCSVVHDLCPLFHFCSSSRIIKFLLPPRFHNFDMQSLGNVYHKRNSIFPILFGLNMLLRCFRLSWLRWLGGMLLVVYSFLCVFLIDVIL